MPATELCVLGPLEVVGENGPVPLAAKHVRLLAALTTDEGRARGVDELVEDLWDGDAPASARKLVQVYVSQLRKALPAGVGITTSRGSYAVELQPGVLDAARFEKLLSESSAARELGNPALAASLADQALALWRGRAYGELAYEDFARAESERLEELRLVAVEERLAARLALGQHVDVLGDVLALADENPFRGRAHELAMLALYRCERQADALEHYAVYRDRLDDELGLEPGERLRELQRRILQQDAGLEVAADAPARAVLPVPPNPLVGRAREVAELCALLDRRESRLVVLTGAGGSGKTRLALEAARQSAGSYANGVVLVELAPLRDPALVVSTIAQALEVSVDGDADAVDAVAEAVAARELLLVVDNAEHVREAASSLAALVARAPRLTILVTSRAVLHVSGENVFPVAPLAEDDAVELFVQRARLLDPSFHLAAQNEPDVREICRRVDCLPLAIELAAGRIRTLTPRALRERLNDRLRLLTGGPRDLPARQQTLRETIEWSVELLEEPHHQSFARLALFPAGATVHAAKAVGRADVDTLAALVDVHLLRRDDIEDEPRFGMLETIREYALDLLAGERSVAERAFADYYVSLVDELQIINSQEGIWTFAVERLEPEMDNVRAALAAAADQDDGETLLRLAGGIWRYWWLRGPAGEGLEWIEQGLASSDGRPTPARATALRGAAGLAWTTGDFERATTLAREAVLVAVEVGAKWDEGAAHTVLGAVANNEGDHEQARVHHGRALEISLELGVEPVVEKLNLGVVALDMGDYDAALPLLEEVLDSHRRNDRPGGIGFALLNIGLVRYALGESEASRRDFEEARECFEAIRFRQHVAYALQGLAAAEAHDSRFESAARLLGEARKELDDLGSPEDGFADEMVDSVKARGREALGDDVFEAAYAEGLVAT
ncbi:MAG TPA: BTAD domain-containing putative transcriptional regulator [Gaiellaceae bacterium]|jgi:predicted ATPase/DNA-binding SARP family transcriptional activator|nr:BTAD domain-containing putative transcriptional regulator [Gaiellaceae bacterium]